MNLPALIFRLKKLHWVFFWSGNWPLLDKVSNTDRQYEKEFKRVAGTRPRVSLDFFKNGILFAYHAAEEYDRLSKHFHRLAARRPNFMAQVAAQYRARANQGLAALRAINRIKNLSRLSGAELARLFVKTRRAIAFNAMIDHLDWYWERLFLPDLETYLRVRLAELGKADQVAKYATPLTTPRRRSVIYQERQQLFAIVRSLRRQPKIVQRVKRGVSRARLFKQFPALERRLERYLARFSWMPRLVNNPPGTAATVWREISRYLKTNAPLKIQAKRLGDDYSPKVLRQARQYLRELRPPPKILNLIKGLRAAAWLRGEDYVVSSESTHLYWPLYTEMARRLGLTVFELKEFTPPEIVAALRQGKRLARPLWRARRRLTASVVYRGWRGVFTGGAAQALFKLAEIRPASGAIQTRVFWGTPGSPGLVVGRARLAFSPAEAARVKPGEILVGATMSAGFVPALRQAAGLVAEYGGLTSHPVIVAREIKIPCVVGVRGLVGQVKTGDRLEINGTTGLVRILK